jgi:TRAP-type C4-dicarboxylate transport system permease small subunit
MQWSDVTAPPSRKMLRQFAGLWLVVFGGLAAWRAWQGQVDAWTQTLAIGALVVGSIGLIWPMAIRFVYTGWMIAAFPIGWTISRVVLAVTFYALFTPVAFIFRLMGRDALRLRRSDPRSYWLSRSHTETTDAYFRQF